MPKFHPLGARRHREWSSIPLLAMTLLLTLPPARAREDAETEAPSRAKLARLFERAINRERAAEGLTPLDLHPDLGKAAQRAAEELSPHGSVLGSDLKDLLHGGGYEPAEAAIALAWSPDGVAEIVRRMRLPGVDRSSTYLHEGFHDLGVGVSSRQGTPFYVLLFGRSRADEQALLAASLADLGEVRDAHLALVNEARQDGRRSPIRPDLCLDEVAQRYAEAMLGESFYGHVSPRGESVVQRVRRHGCGNWAAENLAAGPPSVNDVVTSWLGSTLHRQNLLDPRVRRVGLGVAVGENELGFQILWVQVLGR